MKLVTQKTFLFLLPFLILLIIGIAIVIPSSFGESFSIKTSNYQYNNYDANPSVSFSLTENPIKRENVAPAILERIRTNKSNNRLAYVTFKKQNSYYEANRIVESKPKEGMYLRIKERNVYFDYENKHEPVHVNSDYFTYSVNKPNFVTISNSSTIIVKAKNWNGFIRIIDITKQ